MSGTKQVLVDRLYYLDKNAFYIGTENLLTYNFMNDKKLKDELKKNNLKHRSEYILNLLELLEYKLTLIPKRDDIIHVIAIKWSELFNRDICYILPINKTMTMNIKKI